MFLQEFSRYLPDLPLRFMIRPSLKLEAGRPKEEAGRAVS